MSIKNCEQCLNTIDTRTSETMYATDYGTVFCTPICYSLYFDNESYERTSREYTEEELDNILHTGRSCDCE